MRKSDLAPLGPWPEWENDGQATSAFAYERPDGMRFVYLGDSGQLQDNHQNPFGRSATRIAYRVLNNEAIFLGVLLNHELRGDRLGESLVKYFMHAVEADGETAFVGTGKIHKPLVALTLARLGLQPESTECLVEVLPKSSLDTGLTPKVAVIHDTLDPQAKINAWSGGKFYEVIPPDDVISMYPLTTPDHVVALHTPYLPAA